MKLERLITRPDPVIFDIGCNDGSDTNRFLQKFPGAKVFSFEPDPRNIATFKSKNLNATLFEGVVSDIDGEREFHQCDSEEGGWNQSGSIYKPVEHLTIHTWVRFNNIINVKSITLDTFVKENNIELIDFIWADVQGAEEAMIVGGKETFLNKVKYLYTEYSVGQLYEISPSKERIMELLPDYELLEMINTNFAGGDILLRNKKL